MPKFTSENNPNPKIVIPVPEIKKAILGTKGIISIIAKRLGVEWHIAKNMIFDNEETRQAYNNEVDGLLDWGESKLYQNIEKGDTGSIYFLLKCKGKQRGWDERNIETRDENTPVINITVEGRGKTDN